VYVPEDYDPARAYPLVMALHGGSGHGRLFLWSWVREARGRGVILVAPTATGDTWSLMEPQVDSAHLAGVLQQVAQRWHVDPKRLLLTGMSDGGTFTLLSGLDDESPFTHLAPVAASFHPLLLTMADPRRVTGLPVYLVHGALDWMFAVSVARTAHRALTAAGAKVTYREIADLSHTYPREEGSRILDWLISTYR
jgi:phospholipase/carboxylesterase